MDESTRQRIAQTVEQNEIVLFMKGTPQMPQCGFSAQVIQILDTMGAKYASVNVLADAEIRNGIKEFSDWPTIPQLYIRGEFVGGCDIVRDMFESGELEQKLGVELADVAPPNVSVSERAAQAFKEAIQEEDEYVRLEVDARFNHALSIGPKQPKDVVVDAGSLTLLLDRSSAKRAEGVRIDFVDTAKGAAFKIDNPNEPPRVKVMSGEELKQRLSTGEKVELFDVRTEQERQIAHIEGSRLLDREAQDHIMRLSKDTPLVFYCHHGPRSQQAADFFISHGFRSVYNLDGGIDAWSAEVDPSVPRY